MAALILFAGVCLLFTLFYWFANRKLDYWKKRNVPYEKPVPFFGNYKSYITLQEYSGQIAQKICRKFPGEPYVGVYYGTEPALLIQDPEIIKLVTTKDFYYFNSREISNYTHREITTTNLFFTQGDRWKVLRQNLTPLFSSAKMKNMFHLIEKCTNQLEEMLEFESTTSKCVDIKSLMSRYTVDCICACSFGIDSNAMAKDHAKNPFSLMGEIIFDSSYYRGAKLVGRSIWPAIFYGLRFNAFPSKMVYFFNKIIKGVFEGRKFQPSSRNDFVDLLIQLNKNKYICGDSLSNMKEGSDHKKIELEVTQELLAAQCIVFFAAGFETSAMTLGYTLYELAKHPDLQPRVLKEVDEYLKKHDNKVEYDCVTELPYLDACIDETLRLYPVLGLLTREVVEEYTLPSGVVLDKGVRVHLPVYHLHHDADNFPNPEEFRPERFLGDEKHSIKPHTYMPFGDGPRICIGLRFAKMQMLAGLVKTLKSFRLELAEGMPRKVEFTPTSIVTQPKGPINLKLVKRS